MRVNDADPHSDVERLSEESLYGFVQFMWYAVVGIAASK